MAILKLELLDRESGLRYTNIQHVWINTANVETWGGRHGATEVSMVSGCHVLVDISPDEMAAAIDPMNACPDPEHCCYVSDYLARGPADLTHGGFHAAEKASFAHISTCTLTERTNKICRVCVSHEERIRV
jgi:hypothetical protein